jgi:hypothetical protein
MIFIDMEKRKIKYKMGLTVCKNCGKEFEKPLTEIRRNEKLNRPNFCTRTCVGKNNVKNFGDRKNNYDISQHSNNRVDGYTKFRYHYRNIKKRYHIVDITIDDLIEQWKKQNGICEFSGVKLTLSSYTKINKNPIYTASLDRIDSSKGYSKENIRWVSRAMNWMKNTMSDDMVWELCNLIKDNLTKKGSN